MAIAKEQSKVFHRVRPNTDFRLKDQQVIVANEGESKNVLTFIPPLCLTLSDIANVITKLDKVLMELEVVQLNDIQGIFREAQPQPSRLLGMEEVSLCNSYCFSSRASYLPHRQSYEGSETSDSDEQTCMMSYDCMD
ncbi:unnamed protein product [Timema podura]|uniref:Uncharacterized protein n=1 Tax=Timema podura TaxID=61482 RepID=A0ABN7P3G9_TIMPD|nr:unnamed protein product [Timema podura]